MKGFKVVLIGLLLAVLTYVQSAEVAEFLANNPGTAATAIGAGIAFLRAISTTPIFSSLLEKWKKD